MFYESTNKSVNMTRVNVIIGTLIRVDIRFFLVFIKMHFVFFLFRRGKDKKTVVFVPSAAFLLLINDFLLVLRTIYTEFRDIMTAFCFLLLLNILYSYTIILGIIEIYSSFF